MLLLPPILSREAAAAMAHGVIRLREESGAEVLPENPPGTAFAGPLHIAEFFAELALAADTGLVVDCAHLALYQRVTGRAALDQIDQLPFDHVVELHIAGGRTRLVLLREAGQPRRGRAGRAALPRIRPCRLCRPGRRGAGADC